MGTRADFYVGIGPNAEWIGSISYDGYPDGKPSGVLMATTEKMFRVKARRVFADPDALSTLPSEGWPWPWDDSRTTDFAYAWVASKNKVMLSRFGLQWESLSGYNRRMAADGPDRARLTVREVKDMSKLRMDAAGVMAKSGLLILRG